MCPESRYRTSESLKKLYDNKKREVRKQKAEEKKDILLTGGGFSQKIDKDPAHDLILSIVDPLTVVGGPSYYGSDNLPIVKSNNESQGKIRMMIILLLNLIPEVKIQRKIIWKKML